jgi:hypothetical protein
VWRLVLELGGEAEVRATQPLHSIGTILGAAWMMLGCNWAAKALFASHPSITAVIYRILWVDAGFKRFSHIVPAMMNIA